MKKTVYILSIALFAMACSSSKPLTAEQLLKKAAIEKQILNKEYALRVDQAAPLRGRTVHLTSSYGLEVKNDSVFVHLPYYGRATAPMIGRGGGIRFQEPYTDYSTKPTSKNDGYEINMKVRAEGRQHELSLTVFENGEISLFVRPPQRDAITYYGELTID